MSVPSWFSKRLTEFFGEVWLDGFEQGSETPHICGNFDSSNGGPVGPEGCPACQFLNEKG